MIDATELSKTTLFFKLNSLVRRLNLDIPQGAQQHIKGAYLCLHRIPRIAIVEKRNPAQVEEGEHCETEVKEASKRLQIVGVQRLAT